MDNDSSTFEPQERLNMGQSEAGQDPELREPDLEEEKLQKMLEIVDVAFEEEHKYEIHIPDPQDAQ